VALPDGIGVVSQLDARIRHSEKVRQRIQSYIRLVGRSYSEPVVKTLFAHSGNRCYGDECKTTLTDRTMTRRVLGEIAHICAVSPRGPRFDSSMSEAERHDFPNLMLLCPNCHVLIDEIDPDSYPPDRLREMKARHENANNGSDWARDQAEVTRVATLAITTAVAVAMRETFQAAGTARFAGTEVNNRSVMEYAGGTDSVTVGGGPRVVEEPSPSEDRGGEAPDRSSIDTQGEHDDGGRPGDDTRGSYNSDFSRPYYEGKPPLDEDGDGYRRR
jgi:hypothetical protein